MPRAVAWAFFSAGLYRLAPAFRRAQVERESHSDLLRTCRGEYGPRGNTGDADGQRAGRGRLQLGDQHGLHTSLTRDVTWTDATSRDGLARHDPQARPHGSPRQARRHGAPAVEDQSVAPPAPGQAARHGGRAADAGGPRPSSSRLITVESGTPRKRAASSRVLPSRQHRMSGVRYFAARRTQLFVENALRLRAGDRCQRIGRHPGLDLGLAHAVCGHLPASSRTGDRQPRKASWQSSLVPGRLGNLPGEQQERRLTNILGVLVMPVCRRATPRTIAPCGRGQPTR